MRWTGKIVGAVIGAVVFRRPYALIIGLLIGHLFDIRFNPFKRPDAGQDAPPSSPDPYRVLELDPNASDESLDAAYRRLIAQYHPDKVANAAQEIRELAERRASEINAAYDAIKKARGKV